MSDLDVQAELPEGWFSTSLENVILKIVGGGTPSKTNYSYFEGTIPWMTVKDMNKHILEDTVDHISQEAVDNSATNIIPAGTPIVATRMSLGKIVVANFDSAINQDLKALFSGEQVDTDFLVYWYRSQGREVERLGTGTTVKGIRLEVLRALKFPLPPLAEQAVIAQTLDTLLAQVDNIKARLDAIPKILKTFRQSVLAAAVSGKLTEEWRGENECDEWRASLLKNVCKSISDGDHQAPPRSPDGIPFLVISSVSSGEIDFNSISRWVPRSYYEGLKDFRKPEMNDILYTVTGSFGIPVIVKTDSEFCFQRHIAILKPDHKVTDFRFLKYLLASPSAFIMADQAAKGTAQKTVSLTSLRNFEFQFPPLEEQTKIVSCIEELFTFADQIEQQVKNAQGRVNNLTQSILTKAFRGELTADWRADNPELISGENSAEALLAKIQAEHDKLAPKKKPKKTKKKVAKK